jgi:hypothetical protein
LQADPLEEARHSVTTLHETLTVSYEIHSECDLISALVS